MQALAQRARSCVQAMFDHMNCLLERICCLTAELPAMLAAGDAKALKAVAAAKAQVNPALFPSVSETTRPHP